MREKLEIIIEQLKGALADVDKVEAGVYGFKAAAPRARKSALHAIKELKELRSEIQEKKNSHQ